MYHLHPICNQFISARKLGHQYFGDKELTRLRVNRSLFVSPANVAALVGAVCFCEVIGGVEPDRPSFGFPFYFLGQQETEIVSSVPGGADLQSNEKAVLSWSHVSTCSWIAARVAGRR